MKPPRSKAASPAHGFLLEIGTEELPAAYLPGLIDQLAAEAKAIFESNHLPAGGVESYGTPRRLVLIARSLAAEQRKPAEEVRGPSKQISYGADGKPSPALLGFLKSQKGALAQTKIVSSEKGEYVYLVKPATATPTAKVLVNLVPQLIGKLRAPKTMRWDATGVRFARPVRWLLALYGSNPVKFAFGRLASSNATWVGGPKSARRVTVKSIEEHGKALKKAGILLDQRERREQIERTLTQIAKRSNGHTAPEMVAHGLLDEVTYLVEQPVPMTAAFNPKYLTLPREVLLASMAKHQRVFAVESAEGLLPQCIAILEGSPKKPSDVRAVIERILNARLADSLMFVEEDRRQPLEQMASRLSGVAFHEKLGSMADKTIRLRGLSEPLAEAWKLTEAEHQHLRKACQLAKADLVSTMVKEFPTLQGVVGKYYARDSQEPAAVAEALEEQYLPAGDRRPKSLIGAALSIIDKYDTLTSYFALGIMPTGDQDPFGLRRAAQGIVEVAWTVHRPLPLPALWRARASMEPVRSAKPNDAAAVGNKVQKYLLERFYTFEWPEKVAADCIDAVLSSPCDDLVDAMDRIMSLRKLNGHPGLLKAAKVIERTRNILKGAALRQPQVDPSRLKEPLEQQLWDVYQNNESKVVSLANDKSYAEATTLFGDLFYEPLHKFFDKVLVNVPDEPLQQNRLALMRAIHTLYTDRVADLSKLTVLQHEERG